MVKTVITRTIFKSIVKRRVKSEILVLKSRIKYSKALAAYEGKQFHGTEAHGDKPPCRHYLRSWRSKIRKARAKMDAARLALEAKLVKHRAQVEDIKKTYRFLPQDPNTYCYAASIPRGDKSTRAQLIEELSRSEQKR